MAKKDFSCERMIQPYDFMMKFTQTTSVQSVLDSVYSVIDVFAAKCEVNVACLLCGDISSFRLRNVALGTQVVFLPLCTSKIAVKSVLIQTNSF